MARFTVRPALCALALCGCGIHPASDAQGGQGAPDAPLEEPPDLWGPMPDDGGGDLYPAGDLATVDTPDLAIPVGGFRELAFEVGITTLLNQETSFVVADFNGDGLSDRAALAWPDSTKPVSVVRIRLG